MTVRLWYILLGSSAVCCGAALLVLQLEDDGGFVTPGLIAFMAGSLAGILTVLIGGVLALRGRGPHVLVVGGTVLAVTWGSLFLAARIQDRQVSTAKVVGTPLATAIERFVTDRGSPPERLMDLVPEYLESVPRCPLGLWGREYGYSVSGSEFNLWFSTSFGSGHFWDAGVHRWEHRD